MQKMHFGIGSILRKFIIKKYCDTKGLENEHLLIYGTPVSRTAKAMNTLPVNYNFVNARARLVDCARTISYVDDGWFGI